MMTKIKLFFAAALSIATALLYGFWQAEKRKRVEDREKVKNKSHEIQRKSTKARHAGEKKERESQKQPIDYEEDDDHF